MSLSLRLTDIEIMETPIQHPNRIRQEAPFPNRKPPEWITHKTRGQAIHQYWRRFRKKPA